MKKTLMILTTMLCIAGFNANAQKEPTKKSHSKQISYSGSFSKIVVEDDIDLVLTEATTGEISVSGRQKNTDKLDSRIENGVLYLSSKSGSLKNYVKVNVPVQDLRQVVINGNSLVKSKGNLQSTSLRIYVNGEAMVDVKNLGRLTVINSKDFELDVLQSSAGVYFDRSR